MGRVLTAKPNWDFHFIVEDASEEDMQFIFDAFLNAVEEKHCYAGGGYKTSATDGSLG